MYPHKVEVCLGWKGPSLMPVARAVAFDMPVVTSLQQALWYQYEASNKA